MCLAGTAESTHSHSGSTFFSENQIADRSDKIHGPGRGCQVGTNSGNTTSEEVRAERDNEAFDFWSDEGARLFNEMLDEGSTYTSPNVRLSEESEDYVEDEECEYLVS